MRAALSLNLLCSVSVSQSLQDSAIAEFSRGLMGRGSRGLMDRALDLKPEVTQGCGFVHDCSPGAAQSAAHCSKCVCLDGLNAENTFHSHYTLYNCVCDK